MTVGFSVVRAVEYPFYDGNGNITDWMDGDGTLAAHHEYDPYGSETTGNPPASFGFSTKPLDPTLGLYYYGYRFYSPEWGRWLNRDPGLERGFRRTTRTYLPKVKQHESYQYVKNRPSSFIDYLGLAEQLNNCADACAFLDDGKKFGETICLRGEKCVCTYPQNAANEGFDMPAGSEEAKCLTAHEEAHRDDPKRPYCPPCKNSRLDPPSPKDPTEGINQQDSECNVGYAESLRCMNNIPEDQRGRTWACYMKHIRNAMKGYKCPNTPPDPEPEPEETKDCANP